METLRGIDSARVINVIVTKSMIGSGKANDPHRLLFQYWDFDGNLLAQCDEYKKEE